VTASSAKPCDHLPTETITTSCIIQGFLASCVIKLSKRSRTGAIPTAISCFHTLKVVVLFVGQGTLPGSN